MGLVANALMQMIQQFAGGEYVGQSQVGTLMRHGHPGSKKGAHHKRSKYATGQKAASQYAARYNIWKA